MTNLYSSSTPLSFPRVTDERYSMDEQGLHIKHITEDDNGLYICRASVVSLGSLKTRQITVDVYSKSIFLYLTNFPPFPPLFPFSLVLFVFSPSRHSSYRCLSYPCVPLAEFSRSRKFVEKKTKRQQCSPELCGRRVDDKEIHGGGQRQLRVSRRGEIHRQPQETRDPGRSIQ